MRSKTELRDQATQAGIATQNPDGSDRHREELMDDLRATGNFDATTQIDPMKAQDLKNEISWSTPGPAKFAGLSRFFNDDYIVEPKLDGARVRLFMGSTRNSMNTGRRSDVTYAYIERADNFPHFRDAVIPELAGTVIDCELMMPPGTSIETKPGSFTKGPLNAIMAVLNINPAAGVARQERYGRAVLWAFDLTALKGEDVTHLPLSERRKLLEVVVQALQVESYVDSCGYAIVAIPQYPATAENVQAFLDAGYEGGMIKRVSATYQPGKRSADWQKVKVMSTGDFFIVGSVPGKGKNEGKVGSLKVAYFNGDPDNLEHVTDEARYVNCADVRGFDDATMDLVTDPETGDVKQELIGKVIEVMAQGSTKNGKLRHPNFVRWREDKQIKDCTRDQFELFTEV